MEDFGDFEKVSWVESCLGRRRLTFSCSRRPRAAVARDVGGRWKSQNRKNVYLFPYVKEPLNSKVIKSFVLELRICKCFHVSGLPCSMLYICTFYLSVSWVWYTLINNGLFQFDYEERKGRQKTYCVRAKKKRNLTRERERKEINIYHCPHHHQDMLIAWSSLTLSCHPSLFFIAPGRSYRLYPVSAPRWCI